MDRLYGSFNSLAYISRIASRSDSSIISSTITKSPISVPDSSPPSSTHSFPVPESRTPCLPQAPSIFSTDIVCVAREWRGCGLARAILKHRFSLMRATGASLTMTLATNKRTQHLLESYGYSVVAEAGMREWAKAEGLEWIPLENDPTSVKLMVLRL